MKGALWSRFEENFGDKNVPRQRAKYRISYCMTLSMRHLSMKAQKEFRVFSGWGRYGKSYGTPNIFLNFLKKYIIYFINKKFWSYFQIILELYEPRAPNIATAPGLERWLSDLRSWQLFQRIQLWFPVRRSGGPYPPVTPDPGDLTPSLSLCGYPNRHIEIKMSVQLIGKQDDVIRS